MLEHGWTDVIRRRRLDGRCAIRMFSVVVMFELDCLGKTEKTIGLSWKRNLVDDSRAVKHFMKEYFIKCTIVLHCPIDL